MGLLIFESEGSLNCIVTGFPTFGQRSPQLRCVFDCFRSEQRRGNSRRIRINIQEGSLWAFDVEVFVHNTIGGEYSQAMTACLQSLRWMIFSRLTEETCRCGR